jgi:hypothetical protein
LPPPLRLQKVDPGKTWLFLFNYSDRTMHGVYRAVGSGGNQLSPLAWTKRWTRAEADALHANGGEDEAPPPGDYGNGGMGAGKGGRGGKGGKGGKGNGLTPFPAQIRFEIVSECKALTESQVS